MPAKRNKFAPNNHRYHRSRRNQSPDIKSRKIARRLRQLSLEKELDYETNKHLRNSMLE